MSATWAGLFPQLGLRLRQGDDLELRALDDDTLRDVADVAAAGVHEPGERPFSEPWSVGEPDVRAAAAVRWAWTLRSRFSPEDWTLQLGVVRDGVLVGVQDLGARQFAVRREVATGSWLGSAHHGRGTGTRMRLAVLSLAFDHLGALTATTGAWADNAASRRVSEKCGYLPDGDEVDVSEGRRREHRRYRMTLQRWRELGHPRVEVDGLSDACRESLGAA